MTTEEMIYKKVPADNEQFIRGLLKLLEGDGFTCVLADNDVTAEELSSQIVIMLRDYFICTSQYAENAIWLRLNNGNLFRLAIEKISLN